MNEQIINLEQNLNNLNDFISKQDGKRSQLLELKEKEEKTLEFINKQYELLEQVMILFQKTSQFAREQAKSQIEILVSKCFKNIL